MMSHYFRDLISCRLRQAGMAAVVSLPCLHAMEALVRQCAHNPGNSKLGVQRPASRACKLPDDARMCKLPEDAPRAGLQPARRQTTRRRTALHIHCL
jgi:hypothetical protein